ncbi:hypothetical protein PYCH_13220 [Pyrococcus yayanosii CH1]|uniref:Uncharacterized protein n=1 Tax=Pyrococcus yayanosii (strain CH1 / JCM 16557) TaxID=529709 RepID=F8AFM8_PYRYC|nr:hypothetical protein PYCH_13220 [Pyrococcus yayanosii CH1]
MKPQIRLEQKREISPRPKATTEHGWENGGGGFKVFGQPIGI